MDFLNWLHANGKSLAECKQTDIDVWLSTGSDQRRLANRFVSWCVSRGYARNICIPARETRTRREVLSETDDRWSLARRLLYDPSVATIDRVAGLLVLLYSQPVSRIVRLTIDDVRVENHRVLLSLGPEPLEVPTPLGELLYELVKNRRGYAAIGNTDTNRWLFPGGRAGQHLSPGRLGVRLTGVGVPPRRARNTALIELAGELPAVVFAQLLGFNIKRATQWTAEAGNTRLSYAALLCQDRECSGRNWGRRYTPPGGRSKTIRWHPDLG